MSETHSIFCVACAHDVPAELVTGADIYPHRPDLGNLPFWRCRTCGNFVGCHHKTKNRTMPLGCIPTPELRELRKQIHRTLDPLWESGAHDRRTLYTKISEEVGWNYHTAQTRSVDEANRVLAFVVALTAEYRS